MPYSSFCCGIVNILMLIFPVPSIVSDSQPMESISLQGVTGRRRSTMQKLARRLGWLFHILQSSPLLTEKCSSVLVHDTAGEAGDLYIRSVCFSPDGKYLATGAEDKQIRVRHLVSEVSCSQLTYVQDLGYRKEAHPQRF